MRTLTIRDLRQRWPEAERTLALEKELLITRDGKPVAKLVALKDAATLRGRFDPAENRRWQDKVFGNNTVVDIVGDLCEQGRAERS